MTTLNEAIREIDLTNGGVIAVLLGEGDDLPTEFTLHQQVRPVVCSRLDARAVDLNLPGTVRFVVFGPTKLPPSVFGNIRTILGRRNLKFRLTDNQEHLRQTIEEMLPKPKKAAPPKTEAAREEAAKTERAVKGTLKTFVEAELPKLLEEDQVMPTAEAAKRLFRIAQDKGITTTFGSLQEVVRKYKREHSVGERPASAMPPSQKFENDLAAAMEALENATAILGRVQVEYLRVVGENEKLRTQNARFKEVFVTFKDDILGEEP